MCKAGEVCKAGKCEVSCQAGQTNCAGTCVDLLTNLINCGACGNKCKAGEVCFSGKCGGYCGTGYTNCAGTCVDLLTSTKNCGSCGNDCGSSGKCVSGVCKAACAPGFTGCSGAGGQVYCVPPKCHKSQDPGTKSDYVVCSADCKTAWVSADNIGTYHHQLICKNLGYTKATRWGATCGVVCGFCQSPRSCTNLGTKYLPFTSVENCGIDALGPKICDTVSWECSR